MVNQNAYARVVAQELSRASGRALCRSCGDPEDVRQELLIVAWRSSLRHDGRDHLAYVRRSVRNAMRSMGERARAAKRSPQDRYGRPVALLRLDLRPDDPHESGGGRLQPAAPGRSPEDEAVVRDHVARILARLGRSDRACLGRVARGSLEPSDDLIARVQLAASDIG